MRNKTLMYLVVFIVSFTISVVNADDELMPENTVSSDRVLEDQVLQVRAQLVPVTSTIISAGMAGEINRLSLKEGDRFSKGDLLIGMDCTLHHARAAKARAQVDESLKTYQANKQLGELRSISTVEVDVSAARLAAARAELNVMQALASKCEIKAPFDGRVSGLEVKQYQYLAEGEPMIEILDDSTLEIEMIVPSNWLTWLKKEMPFSIHIEETGQEYSATLRRIGARIDPVSQSIKVIGEIDGRPAELLAGMSGTVTFQIPE